MKKRAISLLTSLIMAISLVGVAPLNNLLTANALGGPAQYVECGDYQYVILDDGTAEIVRYIGNEENIVIPKTLDGLTVTSLDSWKGLPLEPGQHPTGSLIGAFEDLTSIKSVVVPDTVTNIGDSTFSLCINLESITIPSSVKNLGSNVFAYCKDDLTIKCYSSTAGHQYAIDNEFAFELLDPDLQGTVYYQTKASDSSIRFVAEVDIDDVANSEQGNVKIMFNGQETSVQLTKAYRSIFANGNQIQASEGKCYIITPTILTNSDGGDVVSVEFTLDACSGSIVREITI